MKMQITKKHRNDIILIVVVLIAAAVGLVYLNFLRATGDTVTVTVDAVEYGVYSLSENRIKDTPARMHSSTTALSFGTEKHGWKLQAVPTGSALLTSPYSVMAKALSACRTALWLR